MLRLKEYFNFNNHHEIYLYIMNKDIIKKKKYLANFKCLNNVLSENPESWLIYNNNCIV